MLGKVVLNVIAGKQVGLYALNDFRLSLMCKGGLHSSGKLCSFELNLFTDQSVQIIKLFRLQSSYRPDSLTFEVGTDSF